jgi:two-component system chemotaxis response regulator CheY
VAATLDAVTAAAQWILVADDDAGIREVWTVALTRAGYRVLTASNGREALDLMRAVVPDLIVLDLRMPEMSGPAFLKVLQGSPVLQRIPVLIVSGFLQDEEPLPVTGLNIVGRLGKPLRLAEFVGAVRAAFTPASRQP